MKTIYFVQANNVYGNERKSVYLPYAAGCIAAYAFNDEKINSECDFGGFIYTHEPLKQAVQKLKDPFIVAFSCSVWNYEYNKALASQLKKVYPDVTIVFGGHNVLRDFETLKECPEADILIYREGEESFRRIVLALLNQSNLNDIPNIAFRSEDDFKKTKEEGFCLSDYPSPYLCGVFDGICNDETRFSAILETNRGCPFHCAFCDWGTLGSRVRLFPMSRVKAELNWISSHQIEYVYCADGNFGLFDRDEEIAEYIISLKKKTGFPKNFRVCFTKNRTDFVKKICMRFNEFELDKAQTLSFQSMSPTVLENIGRKNISLEHFRNLMNEYNRCGISTSSELILGLPGETKESFTKGLCSLIEYGQHKAIQVYTCDLLPNSEMGSADFVKKFGIKTVKTPFAQAHCGRNDRQEVTEYNYAVIETDSLSREDWVYCVVFSCMVQAFHNIGLFRAAAIYLRNEKNVDYYALYSEIASFSENPKNKACHSVFSTVKKLAEGMIKGENSWAAPCDISGDICWQFDEIYFLKSLEKADEIYDELEKLFCEKYGFDGEIKALFKYQRQILKRVGSNTEKIYSDYDFYDYFKRIYEGRYAPLVKRKNVITVSNSEKCETLYDYACRIVWYGRNKAAALYTSDCYRPQLNFID